MSLQNVKFVQARILHQSLKAIQMLPRKCTMFLDSQQLLQNAQHGNKPVPFWTIRYRHVKVNLGYKNQSRD